MYRLSGCEYCLGVLLLSLGGNGLSDSILSSGEFEFSGAFSGYEYLKNAAETLGGSASLCDSDCNSERFNCQRGIVQAWQSCAYAFYPGENVSGGVASLPEGCDLWFYPGMYRLNHTVHIKPYQSVMVVQLQDDSGEVVDAVFPVLMAARSHCEYAGCLGSPLVMVSSDKSIKGEAGRHVKAFFFPGEELEEFKPLLVVSGYNRIQDVVVTDSYEHRGVEINVPEPYYFETVSFSGVGCLRSGTGLYERELEAGIEQPVLQGGNCSFMGLEELLHDNTTVFWSNSGSSLVFEVPLKTGKPEGGGQQKQQESAGKPLQRSVSISSPAAPEGKGGGASAPGGGRPPDWNKNLSEMLSDKPPLERELIIQFLNALYEFFFNVKSAGWLKARLEGFSSAFAKAGFGSGDSFKEAMIIYSFRKFGSHHMTEEALAYALEQLFFSGVPVTLERLVNLFLGLNNRANYVLYSALRSQFAVYEKNNPDLYSRLFPDSGVIPGGGRGARPFGTVTNFPRLDSGGVVGGSLRVGKGRSRPPIPSGLYSQQVHQSSLQPARVLSRPHAGGMQSVIRSLQSLQVSQVSGSQTSSGPPSVVSQAPPVFQAAALSGSTAVVPSLSLAQVHSDTVGEGFSYELLEMLFNSPGSDQALSCLYTELGGDAAFFLMTGLGLWGLAYTTYDELDIVNEFIRVLRQFIKSHGKGAYRKINESLGGVLKKHSGKTFKDLELSITKAVGKKAE